MYVQPQDLVDAGRCKSLDAAQQQIDAKFQRILNNTQGNKDDRPWGIVQLDKRLDPNDDWVGYEFETGFDKKEDYHRACNYLWFKQDYTCIDREGTGKYPMEIVYSPQNAAEVFAGNGLLRATVQFFADNDMVPAKNPTTFSRRDVGIHVNISTPKKRKSYDGYWGADPVLNKVNKALSSITRDQHDELYGRHDMHWGYGNNRGKYWEFKLFRSLPTLDRITTVETVTKNLLKLIHYYENNPTAGDCTNAYDVLSGKSDRVMTGGEVNKKPAVKRAQKV